MASDPLTLGFSPCPNDTFIFDAWVNGRLPPADARLAPPVEVELADVEALNRRAVAGTIDVTKLSFHAFFRVADRYVMLPSGAALGRGVGPLVVARDPQAGLTGRVATPGGLTTANLLLDLWRPAGLERVELRYDAILPAVAAGEVDAGLIIHESRFTYPAYGLHEVVDLGAWWEAESGLPLPLGGIAARRDLGDAVLGRLARTVRASLDAARRDPDASAAYVARHAQEIDPEVRRRHIELYVNDFSVDLGAEGRAAIDALQGAARARNETLAPPVAGEPLVFAGPAAGPTAVAASGEGGGA